MIRLITFLTVLIGLLMTWLPAMAQWSGTLGVGVVNATGNSRSSSSNVSLELEKSSDPWGHQLESDLYRSKSDGDEDADRFAIAYKAKRAIDQDWYAWGSLRGEQDQFANIDSRYALAVGAGHHLLAGPVHVLDAEAGFGLRKTTLLRPSNASTEAIGTIGLSYEGQMSETLRISQKLSIESGSDNTFLLATSGMRVVVSNRLSLRLAYAVRRNSDITGDRGGKTDTLTTVTVAYEF